MYSCPTQRGPELHHPISQMLQEIDRKAKALSKVQEQAIHLKLSLENEICFCLPLSLPQDVDIDD